VDLPASLAAPRPSRQSHVAGAEPVDLSVFGPPTIEMATTIMLQILLHKPERANEAAGLAIAFDTDAEPRGFAGLETDLKLGSMVAFQVALPGLERDEPLKHVVCRDRTASVQFAVLAPHGLVAQTVIGRVSAIQGRRIDRSHPV
jgi:hypothetical protein